ncbi:hypothetical protein OH77DRAFT_1387471, partial [Trametes cingulata]
MSNQLTEVVPIFDGSGYLRWADLMQAYLQQQQVWIVVDPPMGLTAPTLAADRSNHGDVMAWAQAESKAQGSIRLRLNAEVTEIVKSKTTAKDLWQALKDTYGVSSPMAVFNYFKAAVSAQILANQHPGPAI